MSSGVRQIAVDNFLGSLDTSLPISAHFMNLHRDAQMYGWNGATVDKIGRGIEDIYAHKADQLNANKQLQPSR